MVKSKAQMKIQQTAFMLVAVTLFFALAGLFVLGFRLSNLKEQASSLEKENSLLLASKLANTPEFSCGESFGNKRTNCIDSDKVMALKEKSRDYKDFWQVSDIKIMKLSNNSIECSNSNYPECGIISILSSNVEGSYNSVFVSLCRKKSDGSTFYDKCELAKLMVAYKKK